MADDAGCVQEYCIIEVRKKRNSMFGEDTLLGECWIPLKKYYSLNDGELVLLPHTGHY